MASSYLSRLRIRAWLTTLESWACVRRRLHSLISSSPQTRARFVVSSAVPLFLLALATLVIVRGRSSSSSPIIMESRQAVLDFSQNPRYIDSELNVKYGKRPGETSRTTVRRYTGDSTPYSFPVTPLYFSTEWAAEPPFTPQDFSRQDEAVDTSFYSKPRLLYHIDEPAAASLTQYYRNNIKRGSDILDICSSWISHYPLEFPDTMGNICATGISANELQYNEQLTAGYKQADLNAKLQIPYPDNSFDVVTCVVSIDYLIDPIGALQEVHRVLRQGGKVMISQSNRYFPTKAIALWLRTNHQEHLDLINGFFKYSGDGFEPRTAFDITATLPDTNAHPDPVFVVEAIKA